MTPTCKMAHCGHFLYLLVLLLIVPIRGHATKRAYTVKGMCRCQDGNGTSTDPNGSTQGEVQMERSSK